MEEEIKHGMRQCIIDTTGKTKSKQRKRKSEIRGLLVLQTVCVSVLLAVLDQYQQSHTVIH